MWQKQDILEKKQAELRSCTSQFDSAVAVVTGTVNKLVQLSEDIDEKMKEIDAYKEELTRTRDGLGEQKEKVSKVINNFNALLGVD